MGTFADYIEVSDFFNNNVEFLDPERQPKEFYTDFFLKEISSIINLSNRKRSIYSFLKDGLTKISWAHFVYHNIIDYEFRYRIYNVRINLLKEWDPQLAEIANRFLWASSNSVRRWLILSLKKYDNPKRIWEAYNKYEEEIEYLGECARLDEIMSMKASFYDDDDDPEYTIDNLFISEVMYDKKRWF